MNAWIQYIPYSLLSTSIIMLWYHLFLRNHKLFIFNRLYLIVSLLFLAVLPFSSSFFTPGTPILSDLALQNTIFLQVVEINGFLSGKSGNLPSWNSIFLIPIIISFLLFTRLIIRLISLFILIKKGKKLKLAGESVIVHEERLSPFSFFGMIVLSSDSFQSRDNEAILMHEKAHSSQLHSLDIALVELAIILNWFNPFIWWMKKAMIENHEYLADESVLRTIGIQVKDYQYLIVNQSINKNFNSITNNFHQSLIKNRITKMTTLKVNRHHALRALMCLPIFYFTMIAYAGSSTTDSNLSSYTPTSEQIITPEAVGDTAFEAVETMPVYGQNGEKGLMEFISTNLTYPKKAREDGAEAKVYVQFIIDTKGMVQDVKVIKSSATFYNKEEMKTTAYDTQEFEKESVRVVKALGIFTPGMNQGVPVKVKMNLPITFKLN